MADETQSEASTKPLHRGRVQAQGGGTEKSVEWHRSAPPTESEMLEMCDELETKLKPRERRDRQQPLEDLRRYIRRAAKSGGIWADLKAHKKSFPKRGTKDIRVDLEVNKGRACVPDDPKVE